MVKTPELITSNLLENEEVLSIIDVWEKGRNPGTGGPFAVTNFRLIHCTGLLTQSLTSFNLSEIEATSLKQGWIANEFEVLFRSGRGIVFNVDGTCKSESVEFANVVQQALLVT